MRSLWRIDSPRVGKAQRLTGIDDPLPSRVALADDALVPFGEFVVIRDEISVDRTLEDVTWTQDLPATAHTILFAPQTLQELGEPLERRLDRLRYDCGAVGAGHHVHELAILAVRPGACRIPPPVIRCGGQPVALDISPATLRLSVPRGPLVADH